MAKRKRSVKRQKSSVEVCNSYDIREMFKKQRLDNGDSDGSSELQEPKTQEKPVRENLSDAEKYYMENYAKVHQSQSLSGPSEPKEHQHMTSSATFWNSFIFNRYVTDLCMKKLTTAERKKLIQQTDRDKKHQSAEQLAWSRVKYVSNFLKPEELLEHLERLTFKEDMSQMISFKLLVDSQGFMDSSFELSNYPHVAQKIRYSILLSWSDLGAERRGEYCTKILSDCATAPPQAIRALFESDSRFTDPIHQMLFVVRTWYPDRVNMKYEKLYKLRLKTLASLCSGAFAHIVPLEDKKRFGVHVWDMANGDVIKRPRPSKRLCPTYIPGNTEGIERLKWSKLRYPLGWSRVGDGRMPAQLLEVLSQTPNFPDGVQYWKNEPNPETGQRQDRARIVLIFDRKAIQTGELGICYIHGNQQTVQIAHGRLSLNETYAWRRFATMLWGNGKLPGLLEAAPKERRKTSEDACKTFRKMVEEIHDQTKRRATTGGEPDHLFDLDEKDLHLVTLWTDEKWDPSAVATHMWLYQSYQTVLENLFEEGQWSYPAVWNALIEKESHLWTLKNAKTHAWAKLFGVTRGKIVRLEPETRRWDQEEWRETIGLLAISFGAWKSFQQGVRNAKAVKEALNKVNQEERNLKMQENEARSLALDGMNNSRTDEGNIAAVWNEEEGNLLSEPEDDDEPHYFSEPEDDGYHEVEAAENRELEELELKDLHIYEDYLRGGCYKSLSAKLSEIQESESEELLAATNLKFAQV